MGDEYANKWVEDSNYDIRAAITFRIGVSALAFVGMYLGWKQDNFAMLAMCLIIWTKANQSLFDHATELF